LVKGFIAVDVEMISDDGRATPVDSLKDGPYFFVDPSVVLVEN